MRSSRLLFLAFAFVAAVSANAITFTNSPADFSGADDSIQWSQFGNGVAVTSGTMGTTTGGQPFHVLANTTVINNKLYEPPATQGNLFDPVSITLSMDNLAAGIGTFVDASWITFGYTVSMEARDIWGAPLGSIDQHYAAGTSTVFLGAFDATRDIATIKYTVGTDNPHVTSDFMLEPMQIKTNPVPEPATLSVIGLGILSLRRRSRS